MAGKSYTVKQGDCIASIAFAHGLFPDTLWDHPDNKEIKDKRKDPNILLPGDTLIIPEKEEKKENCSTEKKHSFRKRGVPAKFKIQLLIEDDPIKNQPYSLFFDGEFGPEGQTDGNGFVEGSIPPNVKTGKIIVGPPEERLSFSLDFGTLDPLDTDEGILKRLENMGYEAAENPGAAIEAFQEKEKLEVTGEIDQATRDRIKEVFGQ